MWFRCVDCGRLVPSAALAALGAGIMLTLMAFLAFNIFVLHAGTAKWLNNVCVPTALAAMLFGALYAVTWRNGPPRCKQCSLEKEQKTRRAISERLIARKSAAEARSRRIETILSDDPEIGTILEEIKTGRRIGWKPDEKTVILLRLIRDLEHQSRYDEAAEIIKRLELDDRANTMINRNEGNRRFFDRRSP